MLGRKTIFGCAAALALIAGAGGLYGVTATQGLTLVVPSVLTITAPAAVSQNHNGTDTNQSLGAQRWTIVQNQVRGSTCTFTAPAFSMTNGATTVKRNSRLALAVYSGTGTTTETAAGWAVTTSSSDSVYTPVPADASVSGASTAAGNASLDVTVTFLDTDYSTLANGSYTTTVTGTLAANP